MVAVVRKGSELGCEPSGRNAPAGSNPVSHPNIPEAIGSVWPLRDRYAA